MPSSLALREGAAAARREARFGPSGPHYRLDIEWSERRVDPRALLSAFSGVLATASRAGLDRGVEQAIAGDDDVVALSWLLSEGEFSTSLLLAAFREGVVRRVEDEARARWAPFALGPDEGFPLGRLDGPGLSLDPKVGILTALARDPEAARLAAALRLHPPARVLDRAGREVRVASAAGLLLDHGVYDDDGRAAGEVLAAAVRRLRSLGDRRQAGELTERVAHAVVAGRREVDGVVEALSSVLAEFHVADLHAAAARGTVDDPNHDGDRFVGYVDDDGTLVLPLGHLQGLLEEVSRHDGARRPLYEAIAAHQARVVLDHAGGGNVLWASELGAFTQVLVNANDERAIEDDAARRKRQADVLALIDGAVGLVPMGRPGRLAVAQAGRLARDELAGGADLSGASYELEQRAAHALDALIVAGYLERGRLGPAGEVEHEAAEAARGREESVFLVGGRLLPYGEMSAAQRQAFDEWVRTSRRLDEVVGRARHAAHQAMDDRDKDN